MVSEAPGCSQIASQLLSLWQRTITVERQSKGMQGKREPVMAASSSTIAMPGSLTCWTLLLTSWAEGLPGPPYLKSALLIPLGETQRSSCDSPE